VSLGLSIVGLVISGAALAVSAASALFVSRQLRLAERQRERDFEAVVVAELVHLNRRAMALDYTLRVTNAGPVVARDVDVSVVRWTNEQPLGWVITESDVGPALLRGEQRTVELHLPADEARFDDRSRSVEITANYYDDNGARQTRLAFICGDDAKDVVLTPPQPP